MGDYLNAAEQPVDPWAVIDCFRVVRRHAEHDVAVQEAAREFLIFEETVEQILSEYVEEEL